MNKYRHLDERDLKLDIREINAFLAPLPGPPESFAGLPSQ
jgi:hypothetical protein